MAKNLCVQKNGTVFVNDAELDVINWTCRTSVPPSDAQPTSAHQIFSQLSQSKSFRHLVVGIIGPRDATQAQLIAAEAIGASLGSLGLTLICGGMGGVMEAVSKGCSEAGGLIIGILPKSDPQDSNQYVGVPLPTGLGEARNMIIAKSARVLIAVGGSYGTLSEVAYGLHFSKSVIGIESAPDVEGVAHAATVDEAIELALEALLMSASKVENDTNLKNSNKACL